ncbi:MAG: LptA/OstA family protein [Alphaproteobacteria bacterium]|nr:LptA/OstA family protein [Alphaproteobacteria bacterium]
MRLPVSIAAALLCLGGFAFAANPSSAESVPAPSQDIEVTADKSLEWYEDQNIYVARGNAKAVRGDVAITADLLTAHKRETKAPKGEKGPTGDIDRLTAEGNVVITKGSARILADRAIDDVDKHVFVATGDNLRYESGEQVVTAKKSLEYWDRKKIAVARGSAHAVKGDRHIMGDVLTAEFRTKDGKDELYKMTSEGKVTVVTKSDVVRGDKGVYDASSDVAVVTGNVSVTRADGMQLTGDVGEANFTTNQSRLINEGSGRVRALLPGKNARTAKGGAR